jgi:hypothetical protein
LHITLTRTGIYAALSALCVASSTLLVCNTEAQERRRWDEPINLVAQNSPYDDFAPAWSPAESLLYFNSTATGYSLFYTARYEPPAISAASGSQIHFVGREALPLSTAAAPSINAPRTHQSFIAFARDGSVYFSGFRQTKRRPYLNIMQAAQSTAALRGATGQTKQASEQISPANTLWQRPEPVLALNTDNFNAHPSVSPSGNFIVFASDRPGGRGGTDLWIAKRNDDGEWQPPVNLGESLNSQDDEISPFFASEDSLYFASNGFGGKGGFEIFLAVRSGAKWQAPVPVVELNSEYDDMDFIMLPARQGEHRLCVFASNRPGGRGGLDLYAARLSTVAAATSAVEYKVATQTTFLTVEEFATSDVLPMLPCIFFADNSAQLPSELRRRSSEEARQYSPTAARPDPLGIYTETLNIIGKRMGEFPEEALIITPYVPESPSQRQMELARSRVESIRQYLATVWGIESNRLIAAKPRSVAEMLPAVARGPNAPPPSATALKTTMLGVNERSRCVEFSCNDPRILASVKIGGTNALSKTTRLETYLDARPRNLVRTWSFTALAGTDTLLVTDGTTLPFTVNIPLAPEKLNRINDELRLSLSGKDSLGRTGKSDVLVTVYRISLEEKRTKGIQDKIVERHRILLLDESQYELSAANKETLRSIATTLTPSAILTVSGYGTSKRSDAQVEQFVSMVADELRRLAQGVPNVAVTPEFIGDSDALLSASPQERLFARSVMITVERTLSPKEKR